VRWVSVIVVTMQQVYDPELLVEDAIDLMHQQRAHEAENLAAPADLIEATISGLLYPAR
jgi:hypothetical protein